MSVTHFCQRCHENFSIFENIFCLGRNITQMGRKITTLTAQKKSGPERYGPERRGPEAQHTLFADQSGFSPRLDNLTLSH